MRNFVLDAEVFSDDRIIEWSKTHMKYLKRGRDIVEHVLLLSRQKRNFYCMAKSAYEEAKKWIEPDGIRAVFESYVCIRQPRRFDIRLPADFFYLLFEECASKEEERKNFLKYVTVFDGLLLAYEIGGVFITPHHWIEKWTDLLGVQKMNAEEFWDYQQC